MLCKKNSHEYGKSRSPTPNQTASCNEKDGLGVRLVLYFQQGVVSRLAYRTNRGDLRRDGGSQLILWRLLATACRQSRTRLCLSSGLSGGCGRLRSFRVAQSASSTTLLSTHGLAGRFRQCFRRGGEEEEEYRRITTPTLCHG